MIDSDTAEIKRRLDKLETIVGRLAAGLMAPLEYRAPTAQAQDAPKHPSPKDSMTTDRFLGASDVCRRYSISTMSLWRWLRDADLQFPPSIWVRRRRFWREADLVKWERSRPSKTRNTK